MEGIWEDNMHENMQKKLDHVINQMKKCGIVPVIVIEESKDAIPLADALLQGGISLAEITFRTVAAADSIRRIKEQFPHMLVGAGTILTPVQVKEAKAAGASFIVSPGFNRKVAACCKEEGIPLIPGCMTPTEIEMALEEGLSVVKFFPAQAAGGIEMIKAIAAPYKNVKFMPTGGINLINVEDYLREDCVLACGGSWMVKKEMIHSGQFDKITELTKAAVAVVGKYRN